MPESASGVEYRARRNSAVPEGVTVAYMYDANSDVLMEVEGVDKINDCLANPDYPFQAFWSLENAESMIHGKYAIERFDSSIDPVQHGRAKEHWQNLLDRMVKV